MIKAVAFDYTGVLSQGPIAKWVKENLKPDDRRSILFQESSHKWDMGEIELDKVYQLMGKITGVKPELVWETFFETTFLNKEVINVIKKLKKRYKIVLFSNHSGELLRKLLAKHKITDLFDEIIISSEHKMKKPSVDFFNKIIKITNVKKEELVFIDDSQINVTASNQLGITSILFQSSQKLTRDLTNLSVL